MCPSFCPGMRREFRCDAPFLTRWPFRIVPCCDLGWEGSLSANPSGGRGHGLLTVGDFSGPFQVHLAPGGHKTYRDALEFWNPCVESRGACVSSCTSSLPREAKEGSNAVPLVFSAFIIIRALDRVFLYRVQKTMAPYASTLMSVYWPPMVQFMCFLVCLGCPLLGRIARQRPQRNTGGRHIVVCVNIADATACNDSRAHSPELFKPPGQKLRRLSEQVERPLHRLCSRESCPPAEGSAHAWRNDVDTLSSPYDRVSGHGMGSRHPP